MLHLLNNLVWLSLLTSDENVLSVKRGRKLKVEEMPELRGEFHMNGHLWSQLKMDSEGRRPPQSGGQSNLPLLDT